jgi:flagellin-like protein
VEKMIKKGFNLNTFLRTRTCRKAVSPVIATVVLVAVAITIAVAVSYWMSGISSQYTKFEKIELISAYCESATSAWGVNPLPCWNITLDFRNTGTMESSIIACRINNKAIDEYGYEAQIFIGDNIRCCNSSFNQINFAEISSYEPIKYVIKPGDSGQLIVTIRQNPAAASDYSFSSGTTLELELCSSAGNTYMKMITLT